MPAQKGVDVEETVEVTGLVLQHPREQAGALQFHRFALGVQTGDPGPFRTAAGKRLARYGKTALVVGLRVGDIVPLPPEFAERVQVKLASEKKFFGRLGTLDGRWAVEIDEVTPAANPQRNLS